MISASHSLSSFPAAVFRHSQVCLSGAIPGTGAAHLAATSSSTSALLLWPCTYAAKVRGLLCGRDHRHGSVRAAASATISAAIVKEASYYAVLGVRDDATDEDIKSAFRSKAKKLHPDVNKVVRV